MAVGKITNEKFFLSPDNDMFVPKVKIPVSVNTHAMLMVKKLHVSAMCRPDW